MKKKSYRLLKWLLFLLLFVLAIFFILRYLRQDPFAPDAHSVVTRDGVTYLGQGWGMEERQQLSFTSFGSRIIDYSWFVALEMAENEQFFRDNAHMADLGFIPDVANKFNPDGLPVGVVRDSDDNGNQWVGLTCAACHTGQLTINGKPIRIDGGQSLINYTQFETELLAALKATIQQPEKWQRFISRLQKQKNIDAQAEKKKIQTRIEELHTRYAINATQVPYGHGRLDAFGQIFNAVAAEALNIPQNARSPDAPTSFPVLWDASHLDVVQWNASAPNMEPGPLAQNATTALAVYGTVDVPGHDKTYPSSIQITNLCFIQRKYYKLTSPQWPEDLAGHLDKKMVAKGEQIYQQQCVRCHSLVNSNDPTRKLSAVLIPASAVGTDQRMVNNFTEGSVKTGVLQGKKSFVFAGKEIQSEATRLDVVMHVTAGALAHHPWDSLVALVNEFALNNKSPADSSIRYYKARPINGIWASAPYLHNGSVPTVYDLFLPSAERPKQFFVGNREIDRVKIGNQTLEMPNASLFDTGLPGNSNVGHEYGTQLIEADRMALLEYIKSL
ncbi:di-heme-cytochrome C peroxidase [Cellvibrio sp.]|uniref:di-heme-cytochrome C peroxidase n=1 Tax=Cellvibrio sp. TaxID=1965322 RepID=UPI003964745D